MTRCSASFASFTCIVLLSVPSICFGITGAFPFAKFGTADWFEYIAFDTDTALWSPQEGVVYVVGRSGGIARQVGKDRKIMVSPTNQDLVDIWGRSEDDIYAVGKKGTLLHYDGAKWTSLQTGYDFDFRSVWGSEDGTLYLVGNDRRLLSFDGKKWTATVIDKASGALRSVCELSYDNELYVLSEKGKVYISRNGKWELARTLREFDMTPHVIKRMSPGDKSNMYFLTDAGTIQSTTYWAKLIPYPDYRFKDSGEVVDIWGVGTYHFVSTVHGGLFMHDGYIWQREKGFSGFEIKDLQSAPDSMKTYCLGADAPDMARLEQNEAYSARIARQKKQAVTTQLSETQVPVSEKTSLPKQEIAPQVESVAPELPVSSAKETSSLQSLKDSAATQSAEMLKKTKTAPEDRAVESESRPAETKEEKRIFPSAKEPMETEESPVVDSDKEVVEKLPVETDEKLEDPANEVIQEELPAQVVVLFKGGNFIVTPNVLMWVAVCSLPLILIFLFMGRRKTVDPRKEYRRRR